MKTEATIAAKSPGDLPQKGNLKSLRSLRVYLKPYTLSLLGVGIALIFTSSAVLGIGKGLGYLVDKGFAQHNPDLLDKALLVLLAVTFLLACATYARYYLITYVGERVVADIRRDVYQHVIHLSPTFYETTKTGEILSRITADTALLQMAVGSSLSIALRNFLMLVGGIILLIITSPKLTGYVAFIVPAVIIPIILFGKRVRGFSRATQNKVAELASHAEQSLNGIRTIQAYVQEDWESNRFNNFVASAFTTAMKRVRMRALLTAMVICLVFGAVGLVLWIGGHDVLSGRMQAGQLSSFIFYSIVVAGSVGALSEVAGGLQQAAGATERLFELLYTKPDIHDPENPVSLSGKIEGRIEFNNITFLYPSQKEKTALESFTLQVSPGQHVALVGPSGAGKSTVFQLLLRFYDPQHGNITIDGCPIRQMKLAELRSLFGYVSQDPVIFSADAMENIRYGNPDATDEQVIEAAKAAEAYEFIAKLPQGFQTFLGEKGVRLSGGQRQRIAIARAILKNPKILLLDEATSALDTENEKLVQAALINLMKGRTTLVIAHRLSTVLTADNIVVIDNGMIDAMGTHQELTAQSGLYARLAKLQFDS